MRAPGFWSNPPDRPGAAARALMPLGALYAMATARRLRRGLAHRAGVPVICVGNLTAGGTGKTPTVIALAERLVTAGHRPQVVSRGHGGSLGGPHRVDPQRDGPAGVGDEPLLLSAFLPVWVAKDRAAGVQAAEADGAEVVLLDDGFQNPGVAKDLSIVVVDAAAGFGNGRPIPAGPLREPVAAGLARADLVLLIGPEEDRGCFLRLWGAAIGERPVVTARLDPLATGMPWAGLRVLAFAGIGRPAKFFATLRALGADIAGMVALDDHQPLGEPLLARLAQEAKAKGAQLVTTEKDAVRLPAGWRPKVLTLPVRLHFEERAALDAALARFGF